MNVILFPDDHKEAQEAMNSKRAWEALRIIGDIVRKQQESNNRETAWRCLDEVRSEYFEAIAVLGEDV